MFKKLEQPDAPITYLPAPENEITRIIWRRVRLNITETKIISDEFNLETTYTLSFTVATDDTKVMKGTGVWRTRWLPKEDKKFKVIFVPEED